MKQKECVPIETFLKELVAPRLYDTYIEPVLSKLGEHRKTRTFGLKPRSQCNETQIKEALRLATKTNPQKLTLFSKARENGPVKSSMPVSFETMLAETLQKAHCHELFACLESRKRPALSDHVQELVGTDRTVGFTPCIAAALKPDTQQFIYMNFRTILYYHFGFCMAKREERVVTLHPLLKLMLECIPLGENPEEAGHWMVLAG